jgi:hypothetical protein
LPLKRNPQRYAAVGVLHLRVRVTALNPAVVAANKDRNPNVTPGERRERDVGGDAAQHDQRHRGDAHPAEVRGRQGLITCSHSPTCVTLISAVFKPLYYH